MAQPQVGENVDVTLVQGGTTLGSKTAQIASINGQDVALNIGGPAPLIAQTSDLLPIGNHEWKFVIRI